MKQTLNALLSVVIISILVACSAENNLVPTTNSTVETTFNATPATEPATIEASSIEPIESTAIAANNTEVTKPADSPIADYVPRYENAVYVYEIQHEDSAAIEYKVKMDYMKELDGITAAQFTRFNDDTDLFSYLVIYENDSIYSLQASFKDADELTSEALKTATENHAYFSLLNLPLDQPHQWEDWYTRPTGDDEITHIRNWVSVSEIVNPSVPLETRLGVKHALEVVEYYEEQFYGRKYYVPQIGLVRIDSVMPDDIVDGSDVLIRIENYNRDYDGKYYETLEIYPSKL